MKFLEQIEKDRNDVKKTVVHFLHIGKTGGTSIKETLKNHLNVKEYLIRLHNHNFKLSDVPSGEKAFFFLRHPLQRFVSSFYSRQRQGMPRYMRPWSYREAIAFNLFSTANQLAEALGSDNINYRNNAVEAMQNIQHVKNSFFDWIETEEYFEKRSGDIILIGFQENLISDFNKLKKKLGLPTELILPDDDIKAHRNPAIVDKYLSSSAKSNLANWYQKDIHFYHMCKHKSYKYGDI